MNKITDEEARAVIDGWITEIYNNLTPEEHRMPDVVMENIVINRLAARKDEAIAEGGYYRDVVVHLAAAQDLADFMARRANK
jgi:hypothetical protein